MVFYSPLRYPGGKGHLGPLFSRLISTKDVYAEPFAGGAGVALHLLFSQRVKKVILNDLDPLIYSFWKAVLDTPEELMKLIRDTPVSLKEWKQQRRLLEKGKYNTLALGFAAFYLSRCNHSGILHAGPIGGQKQTSKYKIDARFNKPELIKRIERIASQRDRIEVYGMDAIEFIGKFTTGVFLYVDPPYYAQGKNLYRTFCEPPYHRELAEVLSKVETPWVVSYDDHPKIRELYNCRTTPIQMNYSLYKQRKGLELLISNVPLPSLSGVSKVTRK